MINVFCVARAVTAVMTSDEGVTGGDGGEGEPGGSDASPLHLLFSYYHAANV